MSVVVVTGAAGALGSRVVERLLADPAVERVVGIDLVEPSVRSDRFQPVVADLASAGAARGLQGAFDGARAVLHLAWMLAEDGRGEPQVAEVNRRALTSVLELSAKAGVESFVHLSSATVYGAWPDNKVPLGEDARLRPNPEFPFAVAKAEAERALAEWADAHPSVSVAVLRPSVTVGPGGRPLYQALGSARSPGSGDGGRPVQYLHVDDLAAAVVLAWEQGLKGVFNVAPDGGIPVEHARALAGGVARISLPDRVAGPLSALGWRLWRRGMPAQAQAYANHPWVVAADRIRAAGWAPTHSSEEALVATDDRVHWDDLPPGRRQQYNLLVAAAALAGVGGLAAGIVAYLRRRRSRA